MKKVLIVDDTAFMRFALRNILEKAGSFEVIGEADNGRMAIDKFKELKPDIVTMDITMPEMDGVEALAEIRKIDSSAKVVMITALGQEKYVRNAIMNGAKGFVVKPFEEGYVLEALKKL